jgi:putative membrane protein
VRTLNDAEIKQAEEARDEGESEAVKQVAEMIITDHEASNEQMDELLEGSLNMEDGDMNERIADQAEQTHERLQDLAGAEYDCAYLQAQVQQHDMALEMAKAQLTPAAKEAGVKQDLTAMAPKLEHHRQMAQDAMGQLQGCSAGQNQQSQSESSQERDQQQRTQQSQSQPAPRTQQ